MNLDELNKCIDYLEEITKKFGLETNIQVECNKEQSIIVLIRGLPSMAFSECSYFLKCYDMIIQCIEMQTQIASMTDDLNKMIASMRC